MKTASSWWEVQVIEGSSYHESTVSEEVMTAIPILCLYICKWFTGQLLANFFLCPQQQSSK